MGANKSRARLFDFTVRSNERVAEDSFAMLVECEVAPLLSPGEFVEVGVPGDASQLLRVPLSFSRADAEASTLRIEYAVVGDGTRRLSQMRPGDASTLVGPCGHGWRLPAAAGRALVVAGGIGIPPVVAAAEMLAAAGVRFDAVVAAKTAGRIVGPDVELLRAAAQGDADFRLAVATDDGSAGVRALASAPVAELLGERAYACVYTCGPAPMMAGVSAAAQAAGVACQASLERMMACGFGVCGGCNVAMADGSMKSCCMDGPVFDAKEVLW